jgi:hypothetical protein
MNNFSWLQPQICSLADNQLQLMLALLRVKRRAEMNWMMTAETGAQLIANKSQSAKL